VTHNARVRRQLADYGVSFSEANETSGLEHTARRFEWYGTMYDAFDRRWASVFPKHWQMDARLAEEFCSATKVRVGGGAGAICVIGVRAVAGVVSSSRAASRVTQRAHADTGARVVPRIREAARE
jgi:hypothetical protein